MPSSRSRSKRGEGVLERVRAGPVQEVAVQPVGAQARERALAGRDGTGARGVAGEHLGDEEDLVAPPGDRLADHGLRVAVHLGGVDVGHAEIEAAVQRIDRGGPVRIVEVPSSLADHRNLAWDGTERTPLHALRSRG